MTIDTCCGMHAKAIVLSERSQTQETQTVQFHSCHWSRRGKSAENKCGMMAAPGGGQSGDELEGSTCDDRNVPNLIFADGCTTW